jgi:hypothetical protein
MRIIPYNFALQLLGLMLFPGFVSCVKETEYETPGGKLIGRVSYYEKGTFHFSDEGGVEVILEGSDPLKKAYSKPDGSYEFEDVKSGTYNLIFNKEGYCQHLIMGYSFVGGNKPSYAGRVHLDEIVKFSADSLKITIRKWENDYYIDGIALLDSINFINSVGFKYFVSNSDDVSYFNYMLAGTPRINYNDVTITFSIKLDLNKFPIGSDLFVIVYPCNNTNAKYYDLDMDLYIYYTVNPVNATDVIKITVQDPDN